MDEPGRGFVAILDELDFRERLAELGVDRVNSSAEVFGTWIPDETEKWRKGMTDAGIKAD